MSTKDGQFITEHYIFMLNCYEEPGVNLFKYTKVSENRLLVGFTLYRKFLM